MEKKLALIDYLLCTVLSESKYKQVMEMRRELMAQYVVVFPLPECVG